MALNLEKTHTMIITTNKRRSNLPHKELDLVIKNLTLKNVSQEKVLGVVIDENLSWRLHVSKVLKSVNVMLSILQRI